MHDNSFLHCILIYFECIQKLVFYFDLIVIISRLNIFALMIYLVIGFLVFVFVVC